MSSERKQSVRVALLGCGTVGGGVLRLLRENAERLTSRVGAPLEVTHVLVQNLDKERVAECRREWLTTDPDAVFGDAAVDVVVEVIGGARRGYIERAIQSGRRSSPRTSS
jgi:homoserine dehydrogenase